FVTHDQQEAFTLSDRIIVMRAGRVEQIGVPSEIYDRPRTRFVAAFMGASNILAGRIERSNGRSSAIRLAAGAEIELPLASPRAPGDAVELALRPTALSIVERPSGAAALSGRIGFVSNLGSRISLEIVLSDGSSVTIEEPRGEAAVARRAGEQVLLELKVRDCIVLEPS
ncbi:MAG: TOBE domain-containing protein, partial [Alphaproteobacteria bacterium]